VYDGQNPLHTATGGRVVPRILIVEDDCALADAICVALLHSSSCVDLARSAYEARDLLESGVAYDLVITDIEMPGNGVSVLTTVCRCAPATPVLVISARSRPDVEPVLSSRESGPRPRFLRKPFSVRRLREVVQVSLSLESAETR